MSVKKVPSNIKWNHPPPQIPFDSVLLYISAGTKIYNYEHVTALSPWYFLGPMLPLWALLVGAV